MLPPAADLTPDLAARWRAAAVPRWVPRLGLTALWAVALVSVLGDEGTAAPCTPSDPALCGPDVAGALQLVVVLATPVLLVWIPLVGCVAAVLAAVLDVVLHDPAPSQAAFLLHGAVCAVVGQWLLRAAAAQQRLVGSVAAGGTASAPPLTTGERPAGWDVLRLAVVVVLVAGAVAAAGSYVHAVDAEDVHVARAVLGTGRVQAVDDDDVSVVLDSRAPGLSVRSGPVEVLDTTPYRTGEEVPVLLDPVDPTWQRLVAEPYDATGWLGAALAGLALASTLLVRELLARRARRRLWSGVHPVLAVRLRVAEDDVLVLPVGSGPGGAATASYGLGWFEPTGEQAGSALDGLDGLDGTDSLDGLDEDDDEWSAQAQESFGRAWRGEDPGDGTAWGAEDAEPEDAVLLGSFREGGWALLVTADGVHLPSRPLRTAQPRVRDTLRRHLADVVRRGRARPGGGGPPGLCAREPGGDRGGTAPEDLGDGLPGRPVVPVPVPAGVPEEVRPPLRRAARPPGAGPRGPGGAGPATTVPAGRDGHLPCWPPRAAPRRLRPRGGRRGVVRLVRCRSAVTARRGRRRRLGRLRPSRGPGARPRPATRWPAT